MSAALARELGAQPGDAILIRVEKPSEIPLESLHGRKDDPGRTIRFNTGAILDSKELGDFSAEPESRRCPGGVRAFYAGCSVICRSLGVNTLLLASSTFPKDKIILDDLGIKIRALADRDSLVVETANAVINDALEHAVESVAGASAHPVFTYLANAIGDAGRQIPYSVVTALDRGWQPDAIYLNEWAAKDVSAKIGDTITLEYFYWEPSGSLVTRSASFHLAGILPMTGIAVDRDFTPDYPGITQADTIGDWDPPFPVDLKRVRPRDEDYWKKYRTAPKAFVSLEAGRKLWASRFGNATSIRVDGTSDTAAFGDKLRQKIDPAALGIAAIGLRAQLPTDPTSASTSPTSVFFLSFPRCCSQDCFFNLASSSGCGRSERCERSAFRRRGSGGCSPVRDSFSRSPERRSEPPARSVTQHFCSTDYERGGAERWVRNY